MSQVRINKTIPAKARSKRNIINEKYENIASTDISNETNEPSTSSTLQPYKMGNADYFLPETTEDTHLGPQYIVEEALHLEGLNKNDIVSVYESCKNCEREKQEKTIKGKFQIIKNNWTIKRCILVGVLVTLIEIILLGFLYCTSAKQNEVYFINPVRINIMHNNLKFFFPRTRWSADLNDCAYQCPKVKSKIKFIELPKNMAYCEFLPFDLAMCEHYLFSKQGSRNQSFRDTYYHYFIDEIGRITREGRSLTCPHDEPFLKEDHSEMIIVGVFYWDPSYYIDYVDFSLELRDTIFDFIANLNEKGMLTRDYVLDFPDTWKNRTLLERVKRSGISRISFHENELYRNSNISNKIDRTVRNKLMFFPIDIEQNNSLTSPSIKIRYPFSNDTSTLDYNLSPKSIEITHFIIFVIYENRNFQQCKSSETFLKECWPIIMGNLRGRKFIQTLKERGLYLNYTVGNYFITTNIRDVIHAQIPVNYRNNTINDRAYVYIFIILDGYNSSFVLNDNTLVWFAEAFASIRNDVLTRVKYPVKSVADMQDVSSFT